MHSEMNSNQEWHEDFDRKLKLIEFLNKSADDAKKEEHERLSQEWLEKSSNKTSVETSTECLNTESNHHYYSINIAFLTDKNIVHIKRLLSEIQFKLKNSESLSDDGIKNVDTAMTISQIVDQFGDSVPLVIGSSF
jgi:hypothetical protein